VIAIAGIRFTIINEIRIHETTMSANAGMIGGITIGPIVADSTLSMPEQLVICRGGNSEMIEADREPPTMHWRVAW